MDASPFVALLLVSLVSLLVFLFTARGKPPPSCCNGRRLPPSPRGFPLVGHLPLIFGPLPHRKVHAMAATHGPVLLLRLGRVPTLFISSAAAAKEAMMTRDLAFANRSRDQMIERLLYGCDMVFAPYGEHWRRARRVCVVHLLGPPCVRSLRRVREQETAALLDRVRSAGAVNLSELLVSYASAVVTRAAFGDASSYGIGGAAKLREVLTEFEELLGSGTLGEFVPWLSWVDSLRGVHAKATRTFEVLDGLLERVIADHRRQRHGGRKQVGDSNNEDSHRDFVDVLLDVNEAEEETGGVRFDTKTMKAIIMDMFVAGTDTTYTVLEWAMAELINHPHEMRRLQEEIRAAVGSGGDRVTEDHLEKLRHLRPVIMETLRLHPPGPLVPRETGEDTEVLGYHVPAHTRVFINVWAIERDPAMWERAEEFLPDRFAAAEEAADEPTAHQYLPRPDFGFLPFGAGRRRCPGARFAMHSVELVLASLLYHFDWGLPAGGASTIAMDELDGMTVRLKETLHLVAKPWSPSLRT